MSSHIKVAVSGTTYPFVVDPNSYSEVDIVDFAPRAVSGTPAFSELGIYLDVAQENFKHGFGRFTFGEPAQYNYSGHQIDTRHGHISLYTAYETVSATALRPFRLIVHKGIVLYRTTSNFLRAVNIANTALVDMTDPLTAASVVPTDILSSGEYFFITSWPGRMQLADVGTVTSATGTTLTTSSALTTWTTNVWASGTVYIYEGTGIGQTRTVSSNTGNVLTISSSWTTTPDTTSRFIVFKNTGAAGNPPNNFSKMEVFGGKYYASEASNPYLHWWVETDGSDAEGGTTADTDAIKVGVKGSRIINMIAFNNQLWVGKAEGAWTIGEDNLAYHTLPFVDQLSTLNFSALTVWNGFLIFNIKNTLYKYRSGLQDITPPFWDELPPYKQFGGFMSMFARGSFLYVTALSNVANATDEPTTETSASFAVLLVHDGVGWHKVMDMPGGASTQFSAVLDPVNDYIYMAATGTASATGTIRVKLQDLTELPYISFPTTGDHNWYSSYVDLGFKRIPKSFASLSLSGEFPTNTSVIASYRLDATQTWTTIGTFTSELQEIDFPAATNGKRIQLKLNLQTTSAIVTPIVRAWILKLMIRPDVLYGVTTDIIISDDLSNPDRLQLGLTAKEIRTALKAARSSISPITFTDLYVVSASAYLSSLRFMTVEYENDQRVQAIAHCTFVYV